MTARTLLSLVIGAGLIASAALAGAQGGPKPGARSPGGPGGGDRAAMFQKMMDAEWTKLKLTGGQRHKIDAYMAHSRRAMEAWRKANPTATRETARPQMEKSRTERTAFLRKVLTGKQFKEYEADMKARRSQMGGRGGPGGQGGGRGGPGGPGAARP